MKSIDNLLNNRTLSMGIAIAMVVMYHLFCVDKIKPLSVFYPGFLGVDIFLFVSGYGLCYSFKKNSLKTFYTRRYKRILPIYVVTALILTIAAISKGHNMSIFDVVCNITSLSYYGIGGVFIDWYLSTLMVLYLVFPLLLKLVNRGGGKIGGIVI
jgi:peptidoglycan/LPS O-acetylase OafA/YrhL